MPRVVFALLFVLASSSAAHALAAEPRRVVMQVDDESLPLVRRLAQEIESLGLAVQIVRNGEAANDAAAAIRIQSTSAGDIELSVVDSATGKSTSWHIAAPKASEPAAELIPTRTVELLRASLLELTATKAAPEPPPAAATPKPAPRLTLKAAPTLSLALGPAALYTPRFRPGASLQGSITWLPSTHFGIGASALAPLVAVRAKSAQGSVDLDARLFRLGAVVALGERASPVAVRLGLGAELELLRISGKATPDYVSATDARTSFSPFASVAPRFRLSDGLHAVAELAVGVASPTTTVRIAGRELSDWGRPWGTASLGLELTWPLREAR